MRFNGLDLSLTAIGFCDAAGATVTLSSKKRGMERIVGLLDDVVAHVFGDADYVAIEDYSYGSHAAHAHELGELGGVVKLWLVERRFPYALVPPASLKKFATDKGNANKTAMAVAAAKLGREFADDNQCDAWWLWQMASYRFADLLDDEQQERVVARTAYRDAAVSKVAWPEPAVSA